jgi:hypothetical protein
MSENYYELQQQEDQIGQVVQDPQDLQIHQAALQFLMTADLNSLTLKTLKASLETQFGFSLDDKKELLKETLHKFIENYVYKSTEQQIPPEQGGAVEGTKKRACKCLMKS